MEFSGQTRLNTTPPSVPAPAEEGNQGTNAASLNMKLRADSGGRAPAFAFAGQKRFSPSELAVLFLLLSAIAIFYGFTMRPGDPWSDDFAQYVQEAKNISEGAPYGQTAFIYRQDAWNPGPSVYPPLFPLFLAPVYHEFGLDLGPMKFLLLGFFLGALVVIYVTFRNELAFPGALGLVGLIGFSPFFWDNKDSVLSDIPFLFLGYLALYLTEVAVWREVSGKRFGVQAAAAGLVMYGACGTRNAGIVLIPAVLVWGLLWGRRILKSTVVSAAICGALTLAEAAKFQTFQSTVTEAHRSHSGASLVGQVLPFARFYIGCLDRLWSNSHSATLRVMVFAFTVVLMLVGIGIRHWRNVRVHDVFVLFYLPILISWEQARYLIPVIPVYFFYLILGVKWLSRRAPRPYGMAIASGLAVLVVLLYAVEYRALDLHHLPFGTASPETQQMFAFIEAHATPNDVVEFFAPRTMALYTQRKSSVYPHVPAPTQAAMQAYFCQLRVRYVVTSPWFQDRVLSDFIAANRGQWLVPLSNTRFDVYQLPGEGPGSACRTAAAYSR